MSKETFADAERLGLTPKPRDVARAEALDAKYGKPVSTSEDPVPVNIPDAPPAPAAVISDEPIDLSTLSLADIGTKVATLEDLNRLIGAAHHNDAPKVHVIPQRTARQQEQLEAEQAAGRQRVAFYEQQKVINPKPVDPRDVAQAASTPVFQSGEGLTRERDAKRF